jgi:hypothetical protein
MMVGCCLAVDREEVAPATIYKKSNPDDHVDDGQPEVIADCTQDYSLL